MDAYAEPLARVVEAMQRLVAAREAKLAHLVTSPELRIAALEHVAAAEWHCENRRPFVILEMSAGPGGQGWDERTEELLADYDELAERLAADEDPLLLPPSTTIRARSNGLRGFAEAIGSLTRRLPEPLRGFVVVLAPVWIEDGAAWARDLTQLVAGSDDALRFVIVEVETASCLDVIAGLGARGETVDARLDAGRARGDLGQLCAAMRSAPATASGPRLIGAAGPAVDPPRRTSIAATSGQLEMAQGVSKSAAALSDPALAQRLRVLVFSAAEAMQRGATADAVAEQRRARDLCDASGMAREATVMELVLGGYLVQGNAAAEALEVFRAARRRAKTQGFGDLAVQAIMGVASIELLLGRVDSAITAYSEGGDLAEQNQCAALGIECFRMAGQLLLGQRRVELAATAFRRGVAITDASAPETLRHSSAADNARALARVCRDHGLTAQADALTAQAAAIEQSATAPSGT